MGAGRSAKMVLIHVKKGEDLNFYVEHDVAEDIDDVSRNVITIFNTVLQARRLKTACDDLVQYGPMKPPETQVPCRNLCWGLILVYSECDGRRGWISRGYRCDVQGQSAFRSHRKTYWRRPCRKYG